MERIYFSDPAKIVAVDLQPNDGEFVDRDIDVNVFEETSSVQF